MSYRIPQGHVLERLRELPDESVHCVVTSPPYWGLRDYGIEPSVWGGNADCAHEWVTEEVEREMRLGLGLKNSPASTRGGAKKCAELAAQSFQRGECRVCGAWRGCFGLEPTPEMYLEHAVLIFREVRRVLRADGTLWLNIGDSYASKPFYDGDSLDPKWKQARNRGRNNGPNRQPIDGLKPKDLVGIPWMFAFALRADGWYLRQDIIWHKPNPMPESVTDRCTKAHEYMFLLSKSARYYYDAEAIKEPVTGNAHPRGDGVNPKAAQWKTPDGWDTTSGTGAHGSFHREGREEGTYGYTKKTGRNSRQCVERDPAHLRGTRPKQNESFSGAVNELVDSRNKRSVWTIATEPYSEAHFATFPTELVKPCILAGCPEGGTVLDPFSGSGTTGVVALRHQRNYIGIDQSPEYVAMSHRRIQGDAPLLNRESDAGEFFTNTTNQGEQQCLLNPQP